MVCSPSRAARWGPPRAPGTAERPRGRRRCCPRASGPARWRNGAYHAFVLGQHRAAPRGVDLPLPHTPREWDRAHCLCDRLVPLSVTTEGHLCCRMPRAPLDTPLHVCAHFLDPVIVQVSGAFGLLPLLGCGSSFRPRGDQHGGSSEPSKQSCQGPAAPLRLCVLVPSAGSTA